MIENPSTLGICRGFNSIYLFSFAASNVTDTDHQKTLSFTQKRYKRHTLWTCAHGVESVDIAAHNGYNSCVFFGVCPVKTPIYVQKSCENELKMLKRAAKLLSYSSYSEFVRRTALIVAANVVKETKQDSLPCVLGRSSASLPLNHVWRLANED